MEISLSSKELLEKLLFACVCNNTEDIDSRKNALNSFALISRSITDAQYMGTDYIIFKCIDLCAFTDEVLTAEILGTVLSNNLKRFIRDSSVGISTIMAEPITLVDLEEDRVLEKKCIETVGKKTLDRFIELQSKAITYAKAQIYYKQVMQKIVEEELKQVIMNSAKILLEGKTIDKEYLCGVDAIKYIQQQCAILEAKLDLDVSDTAYISTKTLKSMKDDEDLENKNRQSFVKVSDFGIDSADDVTGGLYTSEMLGIMGITGTGKTRLAFQIAYRAIALYKIHVWLRSGEQGCNELKNGIYSTHAWYKFGKYIPDSAVKYNELTDTEKETYKAAKIDLLESGDYGLLTVDDSPMVVETFKQDLKTLNRDNPNNRVKICVVDYLGLLTSNGNNADKTVLGKTECANYFLDEAKQLAIREQMAWIVINQLTKEETDRLLEGEDARVTGGRTSSAFQQYMDKMVVLSETEKEKKEHKMKLHGVKNRNGGAFGKLVLKVNKGVSFFKEVENVEDEE